MRRLAPLAALFLLAIPAMAARHVALLTEGELAPPALHGLAKLKDALRAKGFDVSTSAAQADYVIFAGIGPSAASQEWKAPVPSGREALTISRGRYRNKPAISLRGGDARGLMYAALDTADRIAWSSTDPFQYVRDTTEKPYLAERGISMYTMQRAYFESRLYDETYWKRYFDTLAADRINSFVVIFGYENGGFMAPLYPFFFDVKEFPEVEMVGLDKPQQARNAAAFRTLIRLAHERGIEVTAGIWDHIYRGGVQGGGIPGASQNAGKRVPGLVWGVTADNLAPYTKAALRRFLEVFPELDAIQFRMHDESGLKPTEVQPFWHDVFSDIKKTHPNLRLDLRAKGLPDEVIDDANNLGLKAKISTKYWMEQMGLPFHPTHINTEDQRNRRHSYADLLRYPQRYRVHWQLWSGGTTRLLLWGDPDYVRRFAATARLYDGDSFEINEMLATWMLGEPHDEKPFEALNAAYRSYNYPFERYWQFYRLWGRLTYNPETSAEVWEHEFTTRFGPQAGPSRQQGPATGEPGTAAHRRRQLSILELPHYPRLGRDESPGQPAGIRRRRGQRHSAISECEGGSPEHHPGKRYRHAPAGRNQPLVRSNSRRHPDADRAGREGADGRRQGVPHHRHRPQDSSRPGAIPLAALAGRRRLQPI